MGPILGRHKVSGPMKSDQPELPRQESDAAENEKGSDCSEPFFDFNPGGDLRSRAVTRAVSSALQGLTSVFGMGTGVTLAVRPPGNS
jgi:hypothetical protein